MSDELQKPDALPDHLSPIWDEMLPSVTARIGEAGMEALCIQVYRMRSAQERITEEGIVVADEKGRPVEHPAINIEKRAQQEVRKWLSKFARPNRY